MDSKELELYHEEQRQQMIELNKSVDSVTKLLKEQIHQYQPVEEVEVTGKVQVNTEKEVAVSNLEQVVEQLNVLGDTLTKAIEKNAHKPLEKVEVKNIADAKQSTIEISNFKELANYFNEIKKELTNLDLNVNVEKQTLELPYSASKPLAVRLSDGKSFYKAMFQSVLGGTTNANAAILNKMGDKTRFEEDLIAFRTSIFNLKPTWGLTTLRYETDFSGTGATADEANGEFKIESGTSANGYAEVNTVQRGQYQAGAMGQAGIGVRIPTAPTGTAKFEWGYTDFNNGFIFGKDATGNYVGYINNGTLTKTYQQDWSVDTLDGNGNSGLILDYSKGVVSQIDFTWYGYGDIEFNFYIENIITKRIERVTGHRIKINNSASIIDPNQPLTFKASNGASTTSNQVFYIGGHQFSVLNGNSRPQERQVAELITNYTTETNTNWQPLIAVRKKQTFRGRANSISAEIKRIEVAADGNLEIRLTIGGTTSNLSWNSPTGRTASEAGCETKVSTTGTRLTTSLAGEPYSYGFVSGNNNRTQSIAEDSDLFLGKDQEAILWVRRLSSSTAIKVQHAHIEWSEEW